MILNVQYAIKAYWQLIGFVSVYYLVGSFLQKCKETDALIMIKGIHAQTLLIWTGYLPLEILVIADKVKNIVIAVIVSTFIFIYPQQ